jgi:hypothetical protein
MISLEEPPKYPLSGIWDKLRSLFSKFLMKERKICMFCLFIYLTINLILDLHGPEKVTCFVRNFFPLGMSTMPGREEEQAADHAFDNAYKKRMHTHTHGKHSISICTKLNYALYFEAVLHYTYLCVVMESIPISSILQHIDDLSGL